MKVVLTQKFQNFNPLCINAKSFSSAKRVTELCVAKNWGKNKRSLNVSTINSINTTIIPVVSDRPHGRQSSSKLSWEDIMWQYLVPRLLPLPEGKTARRTLQKRKTRETRLYKFSTITELNSYMVGNHCNVLYYSSMVVFPDSLCIRKRKWVFVEIGFSFSVVQRRILASFCWYW